MRIIITGGGGFLGQRLHLALLQSTIQFTELVLVDISKPNNPTGDTRVVCLEKDLSEPGAAESLITANTKLVFHLAAIVSSHAEADFSLGYQVNLDVTRRLLEACRISGTLVRFIFSSSLAVYGGSLPEVVNDSTAITPQSSYGIQKAMGELLVNDYSRKGYVEGIVLRLPTVCVRPGRPNKAASSFVSSIIREPLQGQEAVCPVSPNLGLWLSSPETILKNLLLATTLEAAKLGKWCTINLPGIGVTVRQMLEALERYSDAETLARVRFEPDESIGSIVSSWPGRIENTRALGLGFVADPNFDYFIEQFIKNDLFKPV